MVRWSVHNARTDIIIIYRKFVILIMLKWLLQYLNSINVSSQDKTLNSSLPFRTEQSRNKILPCDCYIDWIICKPIRICALCNITKMLCVSENIWKVIMEYPLRMIIKIFNHSPKTFHPQPWDGMWWRVWSVRHHQSRPG